MTKPLVDEVRYGELERDFEDFLTGVSENQAAVGSAVFVEFNKQWAEDVGVGRFGRMTKKDGETMFHAAPAKIDREEKYVYHPRDFLGYIHQWQNGTSLAPPVAQLCQEPEAPQPKKKMKKTTASYERPLLQLLSTMGPVTLVNPSFSTMVELKTLKGGYVTLTSSVEDKWMLDIKDFVDKSEGMLKMLPQKVVKGSAYLGSNVPVWRPKDHFWAYLQVNPFRDLSQLFHTHMVTITDTTIETRYSKKTGYNSFSVLDREQRYPQYNPRTVDKLLSQNNQYFFLTTSSPLDFQQVEEYRVEHSPWFVDYNGEWQEIGDQEWYVNKDVVVDVRASGTYLSRRRLMPPSGKRWVPLASSGTHWVTFSTVNPQECQGISTAEVNGSKLVLFGDLEVITDLIKVTPPKGYIFTVADVLLPGDEKMWSDENIVKRRGDHADSIPVVRTKAGRFFLASSYSGQGVAYKIGGRDRVIPFVPPGKLNKMLIVTTPVKTYAVFNEKEQGDYFLFKSVESIEKEYHLTHLFLSKWKTLDTLVSGRHDIEQGGQTDGPYEYETLTKLAKSFVVENVTDAGMSVIQAHKETTLNIEGVFRFYLRHPQMLVWSAGKTTSLTSFVHVDSLALRLYGTPEEGFIDGLPWSVVVKQFMGIIRGTYVSLKTRFPHKIGRFLQFLRNNLFTVKVDTGQSFTILNVRRGIR